MNALRVDNKPGAETRQAVRDVLFFMADALHAIASADEPASSKSATRGAGHVLNLCADALRDEEEDQAKVAGCRHGGTS